MTGYLILIKRFAAEGIIGELDCIYSGWATDAPSGFGEAAVSEMERLLPVLALSLLLLAALEWLLFRRIPKIRNWLGLQQTGEAASA